MTGGDQDIVDVLVVDDEVEVRRTFGRDPENRRLSSHQAKHEVVGTRGSSVGNVRRNLPERAIGGASDGADLSVRVPATTWRGHGKTRNCDRPSS